MRSFLENGKKSSFKAKVKWAQPAWVMRRVF